MHVQEIIERYASMIRQILDDNLKNLLDNLILTFIKKRVSIY